MQRLEFGKPREPLPQQTLEGEPAKAWCHLCDPIQAFKSLEECNRHMQKAAKRGHDKKEPRT